MVGIDCRVAGCTSEATVLVRLPAPVPGLLGEEVYLCSRHGAEVAGWVTAIVVVGRVGPEAPSQPPRSEDHSVEVASMAVRAKMYVAKLERQAWNPDAVTVTLQCVTRGDENKDWAAATPSGTFTATILNPAAALPFVDGLGDEFYVDISPVPKDA